MDAGTINPDFGLPFVLGVTGHRDPLPTAISELREQIRKLLAQLRADYPATRLMLLSPLAVGADRLVAQEFLALPEDARAGLVAVLPMSKDLFVTDFLPQQRVEFEQLLAQVQQVIITPLPVGVSAAAIAQPGADRDRQYQLCGQFISRHCQVLVALWDGRDNAAVGGTADIVSFRRTGVALGTNSGADDESLLDLEERGPVYHLTSPRAGQPEAPISARWLYPPMVRGDLLSPQDYFSGQWAALDRYNRDLCSLEDGANAVAVSANQLMPESAVSALSPGMQLLRQRYALADAMAMAIQRRWRRVQRALHLGVAGALIAIESAQLDRDIGVGARAPLLFTMALVLMLLAGLVFWRGDRQRLQDRYQDYRALAEGLRVQLFWSFGGVPERAADRYLGRLRNALDWIRKGVRNGALCSQGLADPPQHRLVYAWWVRSQYEYYSGSRNAARERLCSRLSSVLLGIAMLSALCLIAAVWWRSDNDLPKQIVAWSLFCALVPAGLAGVLAHYADKMAYGEHAKLYGRMARLFDYAQELLTGAVQKGDEARATRVIADLGLASLEENGSWVLLHRERPLEMLHPG
jgi:hypothetical protein